MTKLIINNILNNNDCIKIYKSINPLDYGVDIGCNLENNHMEIEFIEIESDMEVKILKHCYELGLRAKIVRDWN